MIHVVIPVHDRLTLTLRCVRSVFEQGRDDLRVIVVDAGSTDGTAAKLAADFPGVTVIIGSDEWWWTAATNAGVRQVLAEADPRDFVFTLNNDTRLKAGCLATLVAAAHAHPNALLGTLMLSDKDGSVVDAGWRVSNWYTAMFERAGEDGTASLGETPGLLPVDVLPGRGTLVPVAAYETAGLYDERRLPHYGADYEFSRRALRAGFSLFVCPQARLDGVEDATGLHGAAPRSLRDAARSLWSIRSAKSLRYRWNYARLVCPPAALLCFIACDTARVVSGTLRDTAIVKLRRQPAGDREP